MDTFTIAVAIILVMLAFQFQQNWLAFGIIVLLILSMRSWPATLVLAGSLVFLFFTKEAVGMYWPILMFALMVLAFLLDAKAKAQKPDYYSPDLGGLMGGL